MILRQVLEYLRVFFPPLLFLRRWIFIPTHSHRSSSHTYPDVQGTLLRPWLMHQAFPFASLADLQWFRAPMCLILKHKVHVILVTGTKR